MSSFIINAAITPSSASSSSQASSPATIIASSRATTPPLPSAPTNKADIVDVLNKMINANVNADLMQEYYLESTENNSNNSNNQNNDDKSQRKPSTSLSLSTNLRKSSSSSLSTSLPASTSNSTNNNNNNIFLKTIPITYSSGYGSSNEAGNIGNIGSISSTLLTSRSPTITPPQLKCNRCDKITRKFESTITCVNCGRLFHKRCVIFPYAVTTDQDITWKCDDCERLYHNSNVSRIAFLQRPATMLTESTSLKYSAPQKPHVLQHSNTTVTRPTYTSLQPLNQYKYEDGRTHICKSQQHRSHSSQGVDKDSQKFYNQKRIFLRDSSQSTLLSRIKGSVSTGALNNTPDETDARSDSNKSIIMVQPYSNQNQSQQNGINDRPKRFNSFGSYDSNLNYPQYQQQRLEQPTSSQDQQRPQSSDVSKLRLFSKNIHNGDRDEQQPNDLKVANVLDVSYDLNYASMLEEFDTANPNPNFNEHRKQFAKAQPATQQNPIATATTTNMPAIVNDDQNKIYVKLNIKTINNTSSDNIDDNTTDAKSAPQIASNTYEFILNDGKNYVNRNMKQQFVPSTRSSLNIDKNPKKSSIKRPIAQEIEINENTIKKFDEEFKEQYEYDLKQNATISRMNSEDVQITTLPVEIFTSYEENKAYISGQRKATSSEDSNWILKPPTINMRKDYNQQEPNLFHYEYNSSIPIKQVENNNNKNNNPHDISQVSDYYKDLDGQNNLTLNYFYFATPNNNNNNTATTTTNTNDNDTLEQQQQQHENENVTANNNNNNLFINYANSNDNDNKSKINLINFALFNNKPQNDQQQQQQQQTEIQNSIFYETPIQIIHTTTRTSPKQPSIPATSPPITPPISASNSEISNKFQFPAPNFNENESILDEDNMVKSQVYSKPLNKGEQLSLSPSIMRHKDSNGYNNHSPVVSVSPVPVPPPPPTTYMTSFQQINNSRPTSAKNQIAVNASSHPADVVRMKEMEKKILDQENKLKIQENKIEELTSCIKRMERIMEKNQNTDDRKLSTTSSSLLPSNNPKPGQTDALSVARNESVKEGNDWRTSLLDELAQIISKYPSFDLAQNIKSTDNRKVEDNIMEILHQSMSIQTVPDNEDENSKPSMISTATNTSINEGSTISSITPSPLYSTFKPPILVRPATVNEELTPVQPSSPESINKSNEDKSKSVITSLIIQPKLPSNDTTTPKQESKNEHDTILKPANEKPYQTISQLVANSEQFANIVKRNSKEEEEEEENKENKDKEEEKTSSNTTPSSIKKPESIKLFKKKDQQSNNNQSSKKQNLSRSEINLRQPNVDDDDTTNGITNVNSDRNENTTNPNNNNNNNNKLYRSSSLERSSSAMASVNPNEYANVFESPRGDAIYENLKSMPAESIQKASYKGYLDRKHFDKLFKTTEKLYCVLEGSSMLIYKKPTDKKQLKTLNLTGCKIKTAQDYKIEQSNLNVNLAASKKSHHQLKNPKSFEIIWQNSKIYQFIAPNETELNSWLNALRAACSINYQFNYNPKEDLINDKIDPADVYKKFIQTNNSNNDISIANAANTTTTTTTNNNNYNINRNITRSPSVIAEVDDQIDEISNDNNNNNNSSSNTFATTNDGDK